MSSFEDGKAGWQGAEISGRDCDVEAVGCGLKTRYQTPENESYAGSSGDGIRCIWLFQLCVLGEGGEVGGEPEHELLRIFQKQDRASVVTV
jgi:hypothetical protein